ncbi:MAG: SusD/RagB family nutrient-binding outer membrane lipoprotein [Flavobacteriales bacterium]|nr:MAG: SusD/RagB family nutrient-binding outer membrane lipoprotein [Flavobacteriales bacterium]
MKKIIVKIALLSLFVTGSGCKKWLDVNKSPNAPDVVSPNLYLGPMMTNFVFSQQIDGRYSGKYAQFWSQNTTQDTWDRHGYLFTSADQASDQWRTVYWLMGYNLIDMIRLSEEQERWDLAGIGYTLKAWGWMNLTVYHGELIIKQAFDTSRKTFDYDSQEVVYAEMIRLIDLAIENLKRTDGKVDARYIGENDVVFKGDRVKWLKLAYGLKAMMLNQLSNKPSYDPAAVIAAVDNSMTSNADDAKFKFVGTANASKNYTSPDRDNFTLVRHTNFFLRLLNGTQFGGAVDPRLSRLIFKSTDGAYYGIDPTWGTTGLTAAQIPKTIWGTTASGIDLPGNYIFNAKSSVPLVTYAQLQFIKAEAAFRSSKKDVALAAYREGIISHMNFVNTANSESANPGVTQISATEIATYLSSSAVPTDFNNLKLGDIMLQKYISQWGWAFNEAWTDLRRYHYIDLEPGSTTTQVFRGFVLPEVARYFQANDSKPVYRVRPRYNSEWVWNLEALTKLGGDQLSYHTKMMWLFE